MNLLIQKLPIKGLSFSFLMIFILIGLSACSSAKLQADFTLATQAPSLLPPLQIVITPLPSSTPAAAIPEDLFYVDATQDQGPISPYVYGSNYGPWLFVTSEMRPFVEAEKITLLRFPAGNWGDQNDLDNWSIDQYISFCKEMNSEPMISVRLYESTPEKAANLVKYANVIQKYDVKYWAIGNEPNLFKNYDTEKFNQEWLSFAKAMKEVDPKIKLIGPEPNQFTADLIINPKDSTGKDWLDEFLKANGKEVDIVGIHRYPLPINQNDAPPTKNDLLKTSEEWDDIVPVLRAKIHQFTGRDLPIAVTEVNSSYAATVATKTSLDSFYNALWWGDSLGRMIRQGVDMVNQFALVGDFGLMGKYNVYPIYYVYQMYQHFGSERLLASSPDHEVSLFAAKNKVDGLTLMFINRGEKSKSLPIKVDHFACSGNYSAWIFDATHKAETDKVENYFIKEKQMVNLPPESMVLLVLDKL